MGNPSPKVILVGKGKGKIAADAQELIKNINPSTVPFNMVDGVIVEMSDGGRYKIDHTVLKQDYLPSELESEITKLGIPGSEIKTIEVIVDLVKTKMLVDSQTNNLLNEYFAPED